MEQNTNMEQNTQAENMGNAEVPGVKKEQKLFTQEEVNSFVQSRLSRMKDQAFKEQEAAYNQRLAELEIRERKMLLKERLSDRGMPRELADIITGTDEKDIDAKLDALQKIYGNTENKKVEQSGHIQVGSYGGFKAVSHSSGVDPVRKAMGLD